MNTALPRVTVVALCHNHAAYVADSLASVLAQDYASLQLIVVDDASTDGSVAAIEAFVACHPQVVFLKNEQNRGNCAAFNRGFRASDGEFLIDLACDDRLLPGKISRQVAAFAAAGPQVGVVYSNERSTGPDGTPLGTYYPTDAAGRSRTRPPEGDVYAQVLARSFVAPTTMLIRRAVLEQLGGYDESLHFEDFDFWVRSARHWHYAYVDAVLMEKRRLATSLGRQAYRPRNVLLPDCLTICHKAAALNRTPAEDAALCRRLRYFIRQCWYMEHYALAGQFEALHRRLARPDARTRLVLGLARMHVPVHALYRAYLRWRDR